MADIVGPISNVVAVADLFIKVGVQCSVYCSGLKNAPRDVRLILNDADRFTATLKGLENLFANNSHGKKLSSLQNILDIVEESRLQLQDLAAKLERGTKRQKITWPLRKEEVAGIIKYLRRHHGTRQSGSGMLQLILASASTNGIRLLDVATGTCISILQGHDTLGPSVTFSHDSTMIASTSRYHTINLWDVTNGMCTLTLNCDPESIRSVAFLPDSTTLVSFSSVSFSDDSSIKLWDVLTGNCNNTIKITSDSDRSHAFSHDARIIALVSRQDDSCIRLWSTADGECMAILKGHRKTIHTLCFSRDSKMLASSSNENDVSLWDIATSTNIATLKGHNGPVYSLDFSHDSRLLASASSDGTIKIWDLETGVCQIPLSTVDGDSIIDVSLIKGTKTLISQSSDEIIHLWDMPTFSHTATFTGCYTWPYSTSVAHNSQILATTSFANSQIQLWDIATGVNIATIEGDNSSIILAQSWRDLDSMPPIIERDGFRYIKVWSPGTGQFNYDYGRKYTIISAVTFSHDSQFLASASAADGVIKVWDIDSNACIATLIGHSSWVSQLEFLPQSDVLVLSSGDRTVKIWDIRTAACTATLEGQGELSYKSIAFSHDYNMLASGMDDGSIEIWNISTVERQRKLLGTNQERAPWAIAFSRSSALLASITSQPQDGAEVFRPYRALKFWSVSTGLCLATVDANYLAPVYISFDDVAPCLFTSVGQFILKGAVSSNDSEKDSLSLPAGDASNFRRGIGLSKDSEWVMWNDDRMIWLLPVYRPHGIAVIESTLAIACPQPHVVFITISPSSFSNRETSSTP